MCIVKNNLKSFAIIFILEKTWQKLVAVLRQKLINNLSFFQIRDFKS